MRYTFLILSLFLFSIANTQPIQQRGTSSVTVQDARWAAQYNMFVPRYADTTAANLQKGIDSSAAMIYCYNTQSYWYRQHNPKKWINIGSGGSDSTNFYKKGGNSFGSASKIGLKDNYALQFITNNVNNVTLGNDGTFYSPNYNWSFNTDYGFQLGSNAGFSPSGDLKVPNSRYMNFATNDGATGHSGFGIWDSAGKVMWKDSLGQWKSITSIVYSNDTAYAKLNYSNDFTEYNSFSGVTEFFNEVDVANGFTMRGDNGGGIIWNVLDSNNSYRTLNLKRPRTSGLDTVAYQSYVDSSILASSGNYVPYTGATSDVDLGAYSLNAQSFKINGTNGNGHIDLRHQASNAPSTGQSTTLFANSSGYLKWKNDGNYYSTLAMPQTADRTYTFQNKSYVLADSTTLADSVAALRTSINTKGSGTVTSVSGTSPISVLNGTTTPAISISQATTSTNGYLSSTDWNTFNSKGSGTVTSVAALTLGTTGTDLSSTVANGTTTPVITLNVPTASATNRGALSSTDWSTFNGKFTLPSLTSGSVLFSNGTTISQNNSNFFWDNTNVRLGIGTSSPAGKLHVWGTSASSEVARLSNDAGSVGTQLFITNGRTTPTSALNSIIFLQARGLLSAPSTVQTGDYLGSLLFGGYQDAYYSQLSLDAIVDGTVSSSTIPTALIFRTSATSAARAEVMRLSSAGNLLLGNTTGTDKLTVTGNVNLNTAGNKIKVATGSNASIGTATLVGGTVTVSTTAVTSSSKIFLTHANSSGTIGVVSVGTITNATSFVINSSSVLDTSTVNWWIIN